MEIFRAYPLIIYIYMIIFFNFFNIINYAKFIIKDCAKDLMGEAY